MIVCKLSGKFSYQSWLIKKFSRFIITHRKCNFVIADALYKATQTGEERILELKKRAQRELDEKERIEGRIR